MHKLQHVEQLAHDVERIGLGEQPDRNDPFEQRPTQRTLHHHEEVLRRFAKLEELHNVWMIKLGEHAALGAHAIHDALDITGARATDGGQLPPEGYFVDDFDRERHRRRRCRER